VYLRAGVATLQQRIALRGRDYERHITDAYLSSLNDLYEEWIAGFRLCPVLTIKADDFDYVKHDGHLDAIAAMILDRLTAATVEAE